MVRQKWFSRKNVKKKSSKTSNQNSQKRFFIIDVKKDTFINTSKVLAIIKNQRENSKEFVSIFQFIQNIQIVLTFYFVFQNFILSEAFSWQKSAFSYSFSSTVLLKSDWNKKSFFIFEIFEIVFIFTFSKADLNQSLKLTKIISLRFVYLFTISRINVFKKKFQIRFVFSFVNFFDFFNTLVFSFLISSISIRFVFSNYFSLRNFSKNSNIEKNPIEEVYKSFSIVRNEKFESNKTEMTIAKFSIKFKIRWKFKIFVKIDNESEKKKSNSSKNFSEFDRIEKLNVFEFNLNFIKSKIQKLKNSQLLFSFSKHHFSFNTLQSFLNTSINADEAKQNEIDENDSSSKSNLSQQNIQKIVLSMFNLFKNNIVFKNDTSSNSFNNDDWKEFFRAQNVKFFDFILNKS